MSVSNAEANLEQRAQLFKALGHPTRLLMVNLIAARARHGEELAAILRLNPATVSHHLGKLAEAGLLRAEKDQYYQVYSLVGDLLRKPLGEIISLPQEGVQNQVETDAYREKVLRTFIKRGRLSHIPAQRKKFQVVLEKIVQEFEPERRYPEREVNHILLEFHDDVAALRRGMIDLGLMQRERGEYWRTG
jgi:hypothetical protein